MPGRVARQLLVAASCAAGLAVAATAGGAHAAAPTPRFGHVFLIVGENASFSEITPRHAPYITGTLRPAGAWLTHYSGLADGSLEALAEAFDRDLMVGAQMQARLASFEIR